MQTPSSPFLYILRKHIKSGWAPFDRKGNERYHEGQRGKDYVAESSAEVKHGIH